MNLLDGVVVDVDDAVEVLDDDASDTFQLLKVKLLATLLHEAVEGYRRQVAYGYLRVVKRRGGGGGGEGGGEEGGGGEGKRGEREEEKEKKRKKRKKRKRKRKR